MRTEPRPSVHQSVIRQHLCGGRVAVATVQWSDWRPLGCILYKRQVCVPLTDMSMHMSLTYGGQDVPSVGAGHQNPRRVCWRVRRCHGTRALGSARTQALYDHGATGDPQVRAGRLAELLRGRPRYGMTCPGRDTGFRKGEALVCWTWFGL